VLIIRLLLGKTILSIKLFQVKPIYSSHESIFCYLSILKQPGHSDCVRSLAVINGVEFLSCSNDYTIKRWNLNSPRSVQTYEGHTSFVYSVSIISAQQFASVSEDRSVRVWSINQSESLQTIRLPATTVWSVCSLTNGDLVAGCRLIFFRIEQEKKNIFV